MRISVAVLVLWACGNHTVPPPPRDAGAISKAPAGSAAVPGLPDRPLGLAQLSEFGWRTRAGEPAFKRARAAEAAGDWPTVVAACTEALAADASHLDAAWLLAIGYAKTGALARVGEPLARAAAGDFFWADASLEHPALAAYLATPEGAAWQKRVAADRARTTAALARSLIVRAGGDLYAYDVASPRWYRLTRTGGHTIAALRVGSHLAYVTRRRGELGVGAIDLERGRATHANPVGGGGTLAVVGSGDRFWISRGGVRFELALDGKRLPAAARAPKGPSLVVTPGGAAHLTRLPIASISADWDDQALASAIRIGTTSRVVSVPSPGVIAGNTIAWSPDRSHVAFVAQLSDTCTPGAPTVAAVVADAATGTVRELARAIAGLSVEWVSDAQLAIAGDHGVALVSLAPSDRGAPTELAGTQGLAVPLFTARCTPPEPVGDTGSDAGSDDENDAPN